MAKYAELSEGARVVFNKEDRNGFDLRDAIATVVDMRPRHASDGCVVVQLDEAAAPASTFRLSDYNPQTCTFISQAEYLTVLPSQPLPEIHTLEDFL